MTTSTLEDMIHAVRTTLGRVSEEDDARDARYWIDKFGTVAAALPWMESHCYCAISAKHLAECGYTPEQCAALGKSGQTLGYEFANGYLSMDSFSRAVKEKATVTVCHDEHAY